MTLLSSCRTLLATAGFPAAFTVATVLLRPPIPLDEARYLTVASKTWHDGTPLVPHLNGEPYGHEPPLLFWLVDLLRSALSVTEPGARLVALLRAA